MASLHRSAIGGEGDGHCDVSPRLLAPHPGAYSPVEGQMSHSAHVLYVFLYCPSGHASHSRLWAQLHPRVSLSPAPHAVHVLHVVPSMY